MIQFWTSGTDKPSVNVVIHANVLDQGAGNWTQSLFMRNELVDQGQAGREMFYRDISITDNVIRNRHLHGITVGETEGLAIVSNTIIQSISIKEGGTISTPTIFISKSAEKVVVARNVAPKIAIPPESKGKGWRIEDNFAVQRDYPAKLDHYRQVFVNAEVEGHASLADLRLLPGSAAARAGAGSQLSQFDVKPNELDGYIQNRSVDALGREQEFTVPEVFGPEGAIDLRGATVSWEFGPAQVVAGNPVRHRFSGQGHFVVAARVTLADGRSLRLSRAVVIPPP